MLTLSHQFLVVMACLRDLVSRISPSMEVSTHRHLTLVVWDYRADAGSHPPLVAVREPREHSKRRKPWNRAFSRIALQGYEKPLLGNIERLTEALDARTNQIVDMTIWMGYFA